MNSAIFYVSSMVFSATAIFALWQLGLKRLMLDDFRDALFVNRDRLYALSQKEKIACDDEAYRSVEVFINLTIRYAHRFTFLTFVMAAWQVGNEQRKQTSSSPSRTMFDQIARVKSEEVRRELMSIVEEVSDLLPKYVAKSSLMFIVGSIVYVIFRSVSPLIARSRQKMIEIFEVEAYRDARFKDSPA